MWAVRKRVKTKETARGFARQAGGEQGSFEKWNEHMVSNASSVRERKHRGRVHKGSAERTDSRFRKREIKRPGGIAPPGCLNFAATKLGTANARPTYTHEDLRLSEQSSRG